MDYKAVQKLAFNNIAKSFEYDDVLNSIARGESEPKKGQLEAIKMLTERGDRLIKIWQHALGIELPEQKMTQYVITRGESLQPASEPTISPVEQVTV